MAIQGFFTGDVKIRELNGVLRAVDGIVDVTPADTYVPYTGATGNVDLGYNTLSAGFLKIIGNSAGAAGHLGLRQDLSITYAGINYTSLTAEDKSYLAMYFAQTGSDYKLARFNVSGLTNNTQRTYSFPDASGTLALASDIPIVTGYVPYTGATGNVDLGEYGLKSGYIAFDLTPTNTPTTQGTMSWNADKESLDLIMNGVTGSLMQDSFFNVKNQTGISIPKGTIVRAAGTVGASGRILIAPFLADGTYDSKFCIGITAETIADGEDGKVTAFGAIRQIDTSAFPNGTVLYASPTTAGAFTSTEPSNPNNIVTVAIVVYSDNNNGEVFVRPTFIPSQADLIKSLGFTPVTNARTLTINGTTYDLSANRTWSVGTVTSIATTGPITGGTITATGTIGITQATTSTDGYLSSTDWNTFNSKQAALTFSAPLINTSGTISIPAATSSVNGYLSSADWDTFNNKQAALSGTGFVKISGTTISYDNSTYYLASNPSSFITLTALSATAPLSYSNTTGVFSISQATTSTDGYLSSTDWNTFNNKQAAGNYITALTGEATASGPGSASVTLSTSAVTGKLLTGLNLAGGGTIAATDSILQAFGKVQNQISGLAGGVTYQGTWNASTNTPTLTSSVGTKGYYYIVDVAGSTNLNGITDWKIGDWAIFNGSTWDKVDNTDAVSSVNGFTGAVSLTTSNIAEGTNLYYLDSRARLALSFTAGSGAYDNTTGVITIPTNTSQLTNGANFITLSSLSASSPLAYNSGSGAFSIQVATSSQNGYLSSTDWTTFNSKQPAGNYVTTDTTQTITALKTFTAKVTLNTGGTDDQLQLVGTAPSVRLTNAVTGATINGFIAMSGGANNYIQGSVSGDMTIGNQNNGKILFGFGSGTATQKMSLDSSGNAVLSGGLTLGSTLSNGTYTYTLPGATGTLALISDVQTGYVPYTGATGAVNLGAYDLTVNGVLVGKGAGTGANNVILGDNALSANTTGSRNVAIGTFPLWKNTTGFGNIAIGAEVLINQTTGNQNIAIGDNTAKYVTTGIGNIVIGAGSGLDNLTTGSYNTILGGSLGSSIGNVSNNIILADGQGNIKYRWDGTNNNLYGNTIFSSTIGNGTYTYTLPSATGTLALTSQIPANPVGGTGTTNYLPKFTGASTIGNSLLTDNGTNIGLGVSNPTAGRLQINVSDTTTAAHLQIVDGTTTLANSFVTNFRNANDGNGRYSLSSWQVQNAVGNDQNGFIGVQSVSGAGAYTPNIVFGQKTGASTYATRMTLDASGNLGLGVTPSAWNLSGLNVMQVKNGFWYGYQNETSLGVNAYFDGSSWKYIASAEATRYGQNSGIHAWYNAPSGTAGNAISFTQAMTLNASGKLSLGITAATGNANRILHINGADSAELHLTRSNSGSSSTFGGYVNFDGSNNFNLQNRTGGSVNLITGTTTALAIASTGAATFSSTMEAQTNVTIRSTTNAFLSVLTTSATGFSFIDLINNGASGKNYQIGVGGNSAATGYANNLYFDLVGVGNIMTLTSGRNVGIGSTSPTLAKVVIEKSGSQFPGLCINNTSPDEATIRFKSTHDANSDYKIGASILVGSAFEIYSVAAAASRLIITSGGNILMGTTTNTSGFSRLVLNGGNGSESGIQANYAASTFGGFAITTLSAAGGGMAFYTYTGNVGSESYSERMRINSSGLVSINTTQSLAQLNVKRSSSGATVRGLALYNNIGDSVNTGISLDFYVNNGDDDRCARIISTQSTAGLYADLQFHTSNNALPVERMRITSGGDVLVGMTSNTGSGVTSVRAGLFSGQRSASGDTVFQAWNQGTSGDNKFVEFYTEGGTGTFRGSIDYNRASGVVRYNTTSDYRLKTDYKQFNGNSILDLIKVYDYQLKETGSRAYGVIAHELQEILPYAVSGVKDGKEMQGVDYSKIVPVLIKAIQEQQTQIEQLKNK